MIMELVPHVADMWICYHNVNILRPSDACSYWYVGSSLVMITAYRLVSAPSRYPNQLCMFYYWPLRNKLQWNLNQCLQKIHLKMSPAKCHQFYSGISVSNRYQSVTLLSGYNELLDTTTDNIHTPDGVSQHTLTWWGEWKTGDFFK